MKSKKIMQAIQVAGKSEGFLDDVDTLLEDMANPVNDLFNMCREEPLSSEELALLDSWLERIESIRQEMAYWASLYEDKMIGEV